MRRSARSVLIVLSAVLALLALPSRAAGPGPSVFSTADLKEWLTYIASDELQGRATYSAGLGLAAAYIADHLHAWGVMPAGDGQSYLQTVKVLSVKHTSRSSVTVRVGRQTRTFRDGQGVAFPDESGGKRTIAFDRVEFAGYGLDAPASNHVDFR